MAPITINGNTINPASAPSEYFAPDASGSNYIIIHLANGVERCDAEQFRALHRLHVHVQEFLGHGSYICRYPPSELEEVRELPWIDHANVYHEDFKIHPVFKEDGDYVSTVEGSDTGEMDLAPGSEPQMMIRILLHDQADHPAQHVVDHINGIPSGAVQSFSDRMIYATLAKKDLATIAALDGVRKIAPRQHARCTTVVARGIMGYNVLAPHLPMNTKFGDQYRGANQVVGVADTGFDNGDLTVNPHPAFNGHVTRASAYTRPGLINDETGHGTHVAGCVLGFAGAGPWRCHGTAPLATLHFQAVADAKGKLTPPVSNILFDDVLSDAVPGYIHNMSYEDDPPTNASIKTYYEGDAPAIDAWLYIHPEFTSVIASGNRGDDKKRPQVIYSGTAKNVITVGASMTTRSLSTNFLSKYGFLGEIAVQTGGQPGKSSNIAKWSSPGEPGTLRKPDIVAPGVCILSAASRDPKVQARPWHSSPLLDEAGETGDNNYMFMNGTSMAAPLVAGHIAVLRDAYITSTGINPTSAMLKALLLHGAEDLSLRGGLYEGHYPLSRAPNNVQGFGLAVLPASITPIINGTCFQETLTGDPTLPALFRIANGSALAPLPVAAFTAPRAGYFRATMVHIDFEGPILQHDVRMRVTIAADPPQIATGGQVTTQFTRKVALGNVIQIDIYAQTDIPIDHVINYAIVWGME